MLANSKYSRCIIFSTTLVLAIMPAFFSLARAFADDGGELLGMVNSVQLHRSDGSWIGLSQFPPSLAPLSTNAIKVAVIDSGVALGHPQLKGLERVRHFG